MLYTLVVASAVLLNQQVEIVECAEIGLADLPTDVLSDHILEYPDYVTIGNLMQTCSFFSEVITHSDRVMTVHFDKDSSVVARVHRFLSQISRSRMKWQVHYMDQVIHIQGCSPFHPSGFTGRFHIVSEVIPLDYHVIGERKQLPSMQGWIMLTDVCRKLLMAINIENGTGKEFGQHVGGGFFIDSSKLVLRKDYAIFDLYEFQDGIAEKIKTVDLNKIFDKYLNCMDQDNEMAVVRDNEGNAEWTLIYTKKCDIKAEFLTVDLLRGQFKKVTWDLGSPIKAQCNIQQTLSPDGSLMVALYSNKNGKNDDDFASASTAVSVIRTQDGCVLQRFNMQAYKLISISPDNRLCVVSILNRNQGILHELQTGFHTHFDVPSGLQIKDVQWMNPQLFILKIGNGNENTYRLRSIHNCHWDISVSKYDLSCMADFQVAQNTYQPGEYPRPIRTVEWETE